MTLITQRRPASRVPNLTSAGARRALQTLADDTQFQLDDVDQWRADHEADASVHHAKLTFTELAPVTWTNASATSWETEDMAGKGAPAGSIVEVLIENDNALSKRQAGIRTPSGAARLYDIFQQSHASMQALVDANGDIESYSEVTANITFSLMGYWS
jgi:hypothetical protein